MRLIMFDFLDMSILPHFQFKLVYFVPRAQLIDSGRKFYSVGFRHKGEQDDDKYTQHGKNGTRQPANLTRLKKNTSRTLINAVGLHV